MNKNDAYVHEQARDVHTDTARGFGLIQETCTPHYFFYYLSVHNNNISEYMAELSCGVPRQAIVENTDVKTKSSENTL